MRVLPREIFESEEESAVPIRIVSDESAPSYRKIDPDKTHPFRQKELLEEVNRHLTEEQRINTYDIQAVRRAYDIEGDPRFFHNPKFGSPQYSGAFAEWVLDKMNEDPHFFEKARAAYQDILHDDS